MDNWLSEIEKDTNFMLKLSSGDTTDWAIDNYKKRDRMARVIREQSAYINASHAVEAACADFNPVDIDGLRKVRKEAWKNMSPHAKEVIDDLAERD